MSAFWHFSDVPRQSSDVRCCEGFRMPAHDDGATHSGAGVRKPPREETAGGWARWRVRCYGDFVAGGMYRRFVERDLRTRPRRLAGLIGRPRWAEPALSGDLLTKLQPRSPVTASDLVASREPAQLIRRFVMLPPTAAIMRCRS